jgi:hypothetical protein
MIKRVSYDAACRLRASDAGVAAGSTVTRDDVVGEVKQDELRLCAAAIYTDLAAGVGGGERRAGKIHG